MAKTGTGVKLESEMALLQERDRKTVEGVNNYFTLQTIRLRD